jgi:4-hydroxybutyryl-CoA dehydratase/vinylacetyl-CoA-Delta-isomerase
MLMTSEQYEESLRKLNLVVYMFGKRLKNVVDNPIIRPSMNAVAKTYEMAHCPEFENVLTATSHITGKKSIVLLIFTRIPMTLSKRQKWDDCWGRIPGAAFSGVSAWMR